MERGNKRKCKKITPPKPIDDVSLSFKVSSLTRNGKTFDLDNLCESFFSALFRLGWFGSSKTNIMRWHANLTVGQPSSFTIGAIHNSPFHIDEPLLLLIYKGKLPICGQDESFINWVKESTSNNSNIHSIFNNTDLGLSLLFDGNIHIGEFAGGKIKKIIDCLYPIIGGYAGAPKDSKFRSIYAEKLVSNLGVDKTEIIIYRK